MYKRVHRSKPYKACHPEETIDKISDIIYNLGADLTEQKVSSNNLFHALSLFLVDGLSRKIVFSSYGKGMTRDLARASAYGEMIERIQNQAFYMMLKYSTEPETGIEDYKEYKYFPDEKPISYNYITDKISRLFQGKSYERIEHILKNRNIICVPFWNVFRQEITYFPYRLMQAIVGSNGMCSGNNKEEALIQGICEVIERHVLKEMYKNPFCPPSIPIEYFAESEIYNRIDSLIQINGWDIEIKDCSMGKNLPVIGVLIRNNSREYAFHLGSDPSPVTALERCFTEMFQGGKAFFKSLEELKQNSPYELSSAFWKMNLNFTIAAYQGHWPDRLLEANPDYEFIGFNHPVSVSDSDDLHYLTDLLKHDNLELYIRDNSFLGFPTYSVYIPGMSEMSTLFDNSFIPEYLSFEQYISSLTNLKISTYEQRSELLQAIKRYIQVAPSGEFRIKDYFRYFDNHPMSGLTSDELIRLLEISLLPGNIDLNSTDCEFCTSLNYVSILNSHSIKNAGEIFQDSSIPECFNCTCCLSEQDCNLKFITTINTKIREIMKSNNLIQNWII
jgi:ribosomal protein S12 methylthiotransferase accessory factor